MRIFCAECRETYWHVQDRGCPRCQGKLVRLQSRQVEENEHGILPSTALASCAGEAFGAPTVSGSASALNEKEDG